MVQLEIPKSTDAAERVPPSTHLSTSFLDLGVSADLVEVLSTHGVVEPTPIQALTIPDALAGRDVTGQAQTGSGKTLAFGLPLMIDTATGQRRRPRSLVLVPTRELANQVADSLEPLAIVRELWLCAIFGGASMLRQVRALDAGVDIVIATPGRLNDLLERGELRLDGVRSVVIDEADQMADMGFLPQVDRIMQGVPREAQVMLFSATLEGAVGSLVRKYQHNPVHHSAGATLDPVETLSHRFIGVHAAERTEVTARICAGARRALVFVRTTHGADRIARQLTQQGLRTAALHGHLSQSRRERAIHDFTTGTTPVLVATNIAARGLHVEGVDVVVHFDLPEDGKTYLHRSGRTARAGEEGLAVTLCQDGDTEKVAALQREAGLRLRIVHMRADDPRLLDLASWDAPVATPPHASRAIRPSYEG